jgi:competence ComEA-like helix-hairpin-helix protein
MGFKSEHLSYVIISLALIGFAAAPEFLSSRDNAIVITPKHTAASTTETSQTSSGSAKDRSSRNNSATDNTTTSADEADEFLLLDINSASAEELAQLEGIGQVLSEAIVDYRSENGDFSDIADIMNVPGIGQGRFDAICENIYVSVTSVPAVTTEETPEETPDEIAEEMPAPEPEGSEYEQEETSELLLVDINTADQEQLMILPGMTEELAEQIISLRENIGRFTDPYELLYCEEMTSERYNSLIDWITLDDGSENSP